ncbi:hypothetical protein ONE63_009253 [Megalurothrips usitatus]|uniref:PDZ domain-containing protein n=1 Tax=Megalurothrips usitatus TaxID=439358 RepID=A0AAV7XN69_9NEOP|nr:hypothetical protein ONE63_009253 [Megalurothrips usitatus]
MSSRRATTTRCCTLEATGKEKVTAVPPLPLSSPPGLGAPAGTATDGGRGWRKDERSERSVRDKIAMFTQSPSAPAPPALGGTITRRLSNKFKSTEDVFHDVVDGAVMADAKLRSRSVVSVDRVGKALTPPSAASSSSSSSSSAYSSFCSPESSLSPTLNESSSTLPRKGGAAHVLTRATSFSGHTRAAAPAAAAANGNGVDEARRASLIALVEQRRRSISKLRGLVIPDKVPDQGTSIVDLPEIRSKDMVAATQQRFHDQRVAAVYAVSAPAPTAAPAVPPVLSSPPWKSQGASNLPKYSPAFKRKSLTVRASSATTMTTTSSHHDLLIGDATKTSSFLSDSGRSAEEESDNDSAVSSSRILSSRSSISHGFSPPASPLLNSMTVSSSVLHRPANAGPFLRRTLSSDTTTTSTTASQVRPARRQRGASRGVLLTASSSSSNGRNGGVLDNNRRVLKAQSVDAINRKNVLFSARCRSGRNLRTGSPLMQRDENGARHGVQGEAPEEEDAAVMRRDPREEIKELERMVSMADTDIESNDALSCDDSVNSSDDTLEPRLQRLQQRVHYRPATLRDLPAADVKVAFLNDAQGLGIELDLRPATKAEAQAEAMAHAALSRGSDSSSSLDALDAADGSGSVRSPPILPKPLSRKSSLGDGLLNGSSNGTAAGSAPGSAAAPRLRSLKKRNASDPLFLERNGHSTAGPAGLHAVSVNDIRKAFEKAELALSPTSPSPPNGRGGFIGGGLGDARLGGGGSASSGSSTGGSGTLMTSHARGSSIDSTTSEDGFLSGHLSKEQFGSITSLASTTSLISQQELQQLIDDANQTLEEATNSGSSLAGASHEVLVVILHRETSGASVGITLAGGADYETKEITVHKVLSGSPAERDGRLQKGDRILSINGRNMKGVTHRESLAILKAPRPEVVLVVSRSRGDLGRPYEESVTSSSRVSSRPPRILEQPIIDHNDAAVPRGPPVNVVLQKDGAGLGFSLEGGKDSPLGDRPLTIKKIFTGGCAEKSGSLQAGDELLSVNNADVTRMSRIEAWGLMKRLPNGSVTLSVRHACVNAE